jgi:hypothetical protein
MKLQTKLHRKIKGGQDCKKNKGNFQILLKHIRKKPMQFIWHTFHEEIDGFYQYVNEDIMIQQCIVLHYFYITSGKAQKFREMLSKTQGSAVKMHL